MCRVLKTREMEKLSQFLSYSVEDMTILQGVICITLEHQSEVYCGLIQQNKKCKKPILNLQKGSVGKEKQKQDIRSFLGEKLGTQGKFHLDRS